MTSMSLFILAGFLLMLLSEFNATSYDTADCHDNCISGLNASNITGARWPEEVEKEHGEYRSNHLI